MRALARGLKSSPGSAEPGWGRAETGGPR
jgi:hypothetical protein